MKESRVNRYKMYKSGKHLVFSLIMSFSVGAILSSSNFLSFDSNDDLHLFLHAKADNVSSNIDWNNWQTAFTVPSANGDLTGSKGHIVVSGIGLKTDVKDGYVQGDTQPTVTLDAYTLRYSKGSAANSISWSKLNGANISNVVLTDPNGNTQSISGWQFLDINGNVTQNLDNAVWVSFPLTSSNGRITYSNNAQGNTWGFNQKFTLSFDLDIPDEAEKPGYKSYRKAVTNQTEPQVVKSYYRDVNNNGDLSNPDKVGVGGSWGQSVTAQAKDLTSQGYYFVKSSEYINDDNHVASSQNSSMSHQLNSDKIADVFYYSNSASVTAKYVDEHNNTLHPDNTYSGVTGETYKTQSINIPNYHLVKVNGEESGNYAMPVNNKSVGNNPVVYEYEPDRESATVQYIDDNTGKILESHNLTGGYGTTDSYSTQDTIKKYENDGYVVVSDNYPSNGVTYNSDTQTFQVHLDNIKLQKETQKGNLKNEHDRVVQAINADPTLTSDEKQKQVQAADQSLQDNDGKVDQAK
ncbi:mucin-binding protein, partial [Fructobacillus fructosus]|uniref:mucin-binding protein n=1 Tax=Fructobacillus fructosus TaxID=1631 RepID=UPI0016588074